MLKYRNIKTEVNGIVFDSKREAARYMELTLLQRAGEISGLKLQPVFELIVNNMKLGKYIADFGYIDNRGRIVIEDAKGIRTPVYRLKKKLMKAIYEIDVQEV